jgi:hypothetical protein
VLGLARVKNQVALSLRPCLDLKGRVVLGHGDCSSEIPSPPAQERASYLQEGQSRSLQQALCIADLSMDFLCREKTKVLRSPGALHRGLGPDPPAPTTQKQRKLV